MAKLVRFDWALKKLLRHKADFEILEGFLSELLGEDIVIKEILESESNKEEKDDKFNRVDLLCKDSKDQLIIIEVQNSKEADYMQRILYGTSKAIVEHISGGRAYKEIKKIYSINIVYFELGVGQDYIYHGTTSFIGCYKKDVLALSTYQQRIYGDVSTYKIFPEYWLLKVNNFDDVAKNTLDEWIYFLKNESLPQNHSAKGLKKAAEVLDIMRMSEEERKEYERYLENLRYQASMFDSTWGDGYRQAKEEEHQARETLEKEMSEERRLREEERRLREETEKRMTEERRLREETEKKVADERQSREALEKELAELKKKLGQ
jgi:predicted transposase/invertase (TIGR01784 family)